MVFKYLEDEYIFCFWKLQYNSIYLKKTFNLHFWPLYHYFSFTYQMYNQMFTVASREQQLLQIEQGNCREKPSAEV